jgi:hypothetical protein
LLSAGFHTASASNDLNILIKLTRDLEDKQLKWFCHINRTDGKRILKKALQLKFKGKRLWNDPE